VERPEDQRAITVTIHGLQHLDGIGRRATTSLMWWADSCQRRAKVGQRPRRRKAMFTFDVASLGYAN